MQLVQAALPPLVDVDLDAMDARFQDLDWRARDLLDQLDGVHARMDAYAKGDL